MGYLVGLIFEREKKGLKYGQINAKITRFWGGWTKASDWPHEWREDFEYQRQTTEGTFLQCPTNEAQNKWLTKQTPRQIHRNMTIHSTKIPQQDLEGYFLSWSTRRAILSTEEISWSVFLPNWPFFSLRKLEAIFFINIARKIAQELPQSNFLLEFNGKWRKKWLGLVNYIILSFINTCRFVYKYFSSS